MVTLQVVLIVVCAVGIFWACRLLMSTRVKEQYCGLVNNHGDHVWVDNYRTAWYCKGDASIMDI